MPYNLYKDFSDPSEKFKEEPRSFCYDLASDLIKEAKLNSSDWYTHEKTIQGILLLLFCWNFAAKETKKLTISKIQGILESNKRELSDLGRFSLLTFNKSCEELIKKIYQEFRSLFGQTGASKALSLLNPQLFVMWDTKIRNRLRKIIKNIYNGESPESYLKFLYGIRDIAVKFNLQDKLARDAILAKKIDEFHYVNIVMPTKSHFKLKK